MESVKGFLKIKELLALTIKSIQFDFVDLLHEVSPAVSLELCVLNLLLAEANHGLDIVLYLLVLECWDGNVVEVDDEVVLDNLVVLDVFLTLGD